MQIAFMAILTLALGAAVVSFAVMGWRDFWRARVMQRSASRIGIRFSREDPFAVDQYYSSFSLVRSGHAPRACNVLHGQIGDDAVRAFDFRYEVGHGTLRDTRRYTVLIVDAGLNLPPVLLWNTDDSEAFPLEMQPQGDRIGLWQTQGPSDVCQDLAEWASLGAPDGLSLEVHGGRVMFFVPMRSHRHFQVEEWFQSSLQAVQRFREIAHQRDSAEKMT